MQNSFVNPSAFSIDRLVGAGVEPVGVDLFRCDGIASTAARADLGGGLRAGHTGGGKRTQYLVQAGGSYKFGYDTGGQQQHFRQEERTSDGTVRGRYGFTDANGYLRVIEYVADETGYHVVHTKTELPQNRPRPTLKPHAPFLGPLPPFIPRPTHPEEET
ncbi:hypothetical protein MTO96_005446 [Rhipicephalus appendiculatus]